MISLRSLVSSFVLVGGLFLTLILGRSRGRSAAVGGRAGGCASVVPERDRDGREREDGKCESDEMLHRCSSVGRGLDLPHRTMGGLRKTHLWPR